MTSTRREGTEPGKEGGWVKDVPLNNAEHSYAQADYGVVVHAVMFTIH